MTIMKGVRFARGTRVVIQPDGWHDPKLGLITDGPLLIADGPFFKVRLHEYEAWHPVEHIGPYLRLVAQEV
ncbi:hypothetical protein [Salipiger sp. PrR002]|uniref:hypothetical protein n=1 Tax=Salipiger sp. PrR002 TaxID=2706489 RepID=UPI0013BBFF58|nr:hypothetical protein [Salipiger sp. PrR002]NDW02771.1 hypothetical protein [Salipiger sp. PrR002]